MKTTKYFLAMMVAVATLGYSTTAKAENETGEQQEEVRFNPSNIIKIGAGYGLITSDIQTVNRIYKSKGGLTLSADYLHVWKSGLGFGINYLYYGTSMDEEDIKMKMHYIGPSFVASGTFRDKWRLETAVGLGYVKYIEKDKTPYLSITMTDSNIGLMYQAGIEYRIAKQVGIGLQVDYFTVKLTQPEGYNSSKQYDYYGIKRLDTTLGLRFYL